jgi:hypothetical protein
MLGIVLELFVVEEKLLAGGEYEFSAAIDALQDLILEFHGRLPQEQGMGRNRPWCSTARRSRFPCLRASFCNQGPGRTKLAANECKVRSEGLDDCESFPPCKLQHGETELQIVTGRPDLLSPAASQMNSTQPPGRHMSQLG